MAVKLGSTGPTKLDSISSKGLRRHAEPFYSLVPEEIGYRNEHRADCHEQQRIVHKIREYHQRNTAQQRNRGSLLSPIDEKPQAYRAKEQSPKQPGLNANSPFRGLRV